jgi:DNA-binding beta-propeller fold protein YncE
MESVRWFLIPALVLFLAAPARAASPGALTQLPGTAGCVANHLTGCGKAYGLDEVDGLALSPDGRFVYTASSYNGRDNAIAILGRAASGALTPKGCISQTGRKPCVKGRGLRGAIEVIVSPDGLSVYVAAPHSGDDFDRNGSLAVFARDPNNGALTQLPGMAGCISAEGRDGCAVGRAMAGLGGIAISPDGRSVYATSSNSDALLVFGRDAASGALAQLDGAAGCFRRRGGEGCTAGRGLRAAVSVVVSPDGRNVYTAGSLASNTVAVFARDVATGQLRQPAGAQGCISEGGHGACTAGRGLESSVRVEISPDGLNVYVAAFGSNSIAVLSRDPTTGALTQAAGAPGCVATDARDGCALGRGLGGTVSVAVAPDGGTVYAAGSADGTVAAFHREAGGQLTQLAGRDRCAGRYFSCRRARGLGFAFDVRVSPDGRNVYVAGAADDAVAVFRRG